MPHRPELASLSEGQVLEPVELTVAEAAGLNSTGLVTAQPASGGWRVVAEHRIGAVTCGALSVRVRPKVGAVQVLRLLARAHGVDGLRISDRLTDVEATGAVEPDLNSVLAVLFAQEAAGALAAGPLRGYRTQDQTAAVVRGRIRLREQELRRFGAPVPIEITVDEWTTDTVENRRIRAATRRLLTVPGLPRHVVVRLRRVDHGLADVRLGPRGAPISAWQPTRLNARLHRLLTLTDLVLDRIGIEHRVGDVDVHGYSLSMAWLFEQLVTRVLTDAGLGVQSQPSYPLDDDGLLTIQPDLVFLRGGAAVGVADVKYKRLDKPGAVPNADVYQLVTYCRRLGLETGHLIYAADHPSFPLCLSQVGVTIWVHSVDLSATVDVIEARIVGAVAAAV